ncbi:hypothetical protein QOT17_007660 [Balamuthia mandrillaris]
MVAIQGRSFQHLPTSLVGQAGELAEGVGQSHGWDDVGIVDDGHHPSHLAFSRAWVGLLTAKEFRVAPEEASVLGEGHHLVKVLELHLREGFRGVPLVLCDGQEVCWFFRCVALGAPCGKVVLVSWARFALV